MPLPYRDRFLHRYLSILYTSIMCYHTTFFAHRKAEGLRNRQKTGMIGTKGCGDYGLC